MKAVSSSPVTFGADAGEGQTSYGVTYGLSTSEVRRFFSTEKH